jgi:hypothetical protein
MTIPTPANDNHPRNADSFPDLAARRAWLATLPDRAKPVLAWPTAERLERLASPAAVQALFRYAELMRPARSVAANDNREPGTDIDVEMRRETRPSINETLRAAAADGLRVSVISAKVGGQWTIIARQRGRDAICGRLGNLEFRDGAMISWGSTKRGKPLRPVDRNRAPRGNSAWRPAPSRVRYLVKSDDPIAKGAHFLGGLTRPRGNCSRPDVGEVQAELELRRNARRDAVRLAIGSEHARVLDLAISDATAREVGEELGHSGKVAERRAIRAINDALEKFAQLSAA